MRREANRTPLLFIDRDGAKRGSGVGQIEPAELAAGRALHAARTSLPKVARSTHERAFRSRSGHYVARRRRGPRHQALHALRQREGVGAREAIQRDIFESAEGLAGMLQAREGALGMRVAGGEPERRGRLRRSAKQREGRR